MHEAIKLEEKYERNGWPSLTRPDLKPPAGWSLSLITGVDRVRNHALSPDGTRIAFIWDRADLSDVYVMPATGGWPGRVSTHRALTAYWSDEVPRWSPDGAWLAFTMDDHVHVAPAGGGAGRPSTARPPPGRRLPHPARKRSRDRTLRSAARRPGSGRD